MQLIKLNPDHYVVVDDSEIKEGNIVVEKLITGDYELFTIHTLNDIDRSSQKKITYSTQPESLGMGWMQSVQPLLLSEVKELLGVVDVEALEKRYYQQLEQRREVAKNFTGQVAGRHPDMFGHNEVHHMVRGYLEGYNQALEDNKEKKYTEEDLKKAIKLAQVVERDHEDSDGYLLYSKDEIIQSLKPQTEWKVEFVGGKLKLK